MTITGVVGTIKWAYYVAAAINGYAVVRTEGRWTLRATVVMSDAFKLAQRPLLFVAPHNKGEWRWPLETFEIQNGVLTARLGKPEKGTHGTQQIRPARSHQVVSG